MYKVSIYKVTQEKVATRDYKDTGKKDELSGEAVYGYIHDYEEKDVSREILSQQVDDLDLTAVIKAINGLN